MKEKVASLGDMGITAMWLPRTFDCCFGAAPLESSTDPRNVLPSTCSSYQGFFARGQRLRHRAYFLLLPRPLPFAPALPLLPLLGARSCSLVVTFRGPIH
jgi:hypothetical protein